MKVMLRRNASGGLTVYVAKKDLEEDVVNETHTEEARILTLSNGWELAIENWVDLLKLPQTVEAKRLA